MWKKFKAFKFKTITIILLMTIFYLIGFNLDVPFLIGAGHVLGCGLILWFFWVCIYHVTKNTWNDGMKVLAVIYGLAVAAMFIFVAYMVLKNWIGLF